MEVTPGKWYAVTTDSSCTVTDANGKVLCTAEAGEQKYFLATTPSITLSDEGATVTKATFNCALAALGLLGGGADKIPAEYTRADFLESEGGAYVSAVANFDPSTNNTLQLNVSLLYNGGLPASWFLEGNIKSYSLGLYRGSEAVLMVKAVGASGGSVPLGKNNLGLLVDKQNNVAYLLLNGKINRSRNYETMPACSDLRIMGYDSASHGALTLPHFSFTAKVDGRQVLCLLPALDKNGVPCMYDTVTGKPHYNDGTGQFIAGVKDAAQLRTVLRKLPDLTGQDMGTLTLSIPAEANTPEMQERLDSTETQKNWELTIQERAAEVATYSLRRVRKVVWVRKLRDENGSYVAADGSRWQAEWCSAIYSPLGNDPTLHGYEPFDSVAQAVEAWGLAPYEYPEDELLTA